MKLKLLLLIYLPSLIFPQLNIHKDTSFTIYSAYEKEAKNYPFIKIVKAELTEGVIDKENIIYSSVDGRNLHLDLFSPSNKDKGPFPIVILIHGGGWNREINLCSIRWQ